MSDEQQIEIAETLFPSRIVQKWTRLEVRESEIPLLTVDELERAAGKLKVKKAPGPDQLPAEVVRAVLQDQKHVCLEILSRIITIGVFPKEWKEAKLVLIEKEKKTNQLDRTYRPICLINVLGKLLEQLLLARLKDEIDRHGGLSENQYGFREGRSTIGAINKVKDTADDAYNGPYSSRKLCALITVDVKNAFNSVPWNGILGELHRRQITPYLYNILASYLEERILYIGNKGKMEITCGVPQGSVLGPTLWNIYYDGVFRVPVPRGVTLIGYADDLAVVVTARNAEMLKVVAEHALHNVAEWLESKDLQMAPQKTEAVLLVGGRKTKSIDFKIGDCELQSQEVVRYLGVYFDRNMKMGAHIRRTAEKANGVLSTLSRLMPKFGGPGENNRLLLGSAVQSILLYGASVWSNTMEKDTYRRVYLSTQRRVAIRTIRAYRTVSTRALQVLARMPPIDLLATQRARIEKEGRESLSDIRDAMLNTWKERWLLDEGTANWTRRLIKDLRPWIDRAHGELDFFSTQVLTGHGCFGAYLKRFKLRDSDRCIYCSEEDTVEHTFFKCPRWSMQRMQTESQVGELTPENIVEKMLKCAENWQKITGLAKTIISSKIS